MSICYYTSQLNILRHSSYFVMCKMRSYKLFVAITDSTVTELVVIQVDVTMVTEVEYVILLTRHPSVLSGSGSDFPPPKAIADTLIPVITAKLAKIPDIAP